MTNAAGNIPAAFAVPKATCLYKMLFEVLKASLNRLYQRDFPQTVTFDKYRAVFCYGYIPTDRM